MLLVTLFRRTPRSYTWPRANITGFPVLGSFTMAIAVFNPSSSQALPNTSSAFI